jgi:hypothetical protein
MSKMLREIVYLVLEPTRSRYGNREVCGFKVSRAVSKEPTRKAAPYVFGLTLEIPIEVFEPSKLHAELTVEKEDVDVQVSTSKIPKRAKTSWGM